MAALLTAILILLGGLALGRRWWIPAVVAAAGAGALVSRHAPEPGWRLPGPSPRADMVTSATCRGCHPSEYATWHRSYHRTMTQRATPKTVLGRFDQILRDRGRAMRVQTQGERLVAQLLDPRGGVQHSGPIELVTGSHHLQNYWIRDGDWFVQLPFTWLIAEDRWIPTQDSFLQPSGPRPQPPAIWNDNCLYCHTTGPAGRVAADGSTARTGVAELGIACEGCHGPADAHVAAQRSMFGRYARHFDDAADPQITLPSRLDHRRRAAVCGQCHGIFVRTDGEALSAGQDAFRPGDHLAPTRLLLQPVQNPAGPGPLVFPPLEGPMQARLQGTVVSIVGVEPSGLHLSGGVAGFAGLAIGETRIAGTVRPYPGGARFEPRDSDAAARAIGYRGGLPSPYETGGFWPDGTVRSTGREMNGLAASGCFTRGALECGSCHQMHGAAPDDMLRPGHRGDAACAQCHQMAGDHSHHPTDTAGARCQNCHMPHTTFGLLGAIRSHRIDSPNAQLSAQTGRPNACNLCHLDKPLGWTARHLTDWFGQARVDVPSPLPAAVEWMLAGDAAQRAVAAWAFGWPPAVRASGDTWFVPLVARLLFDDYPAVRAVAWKVLGARPELAGLDYDFAAPPDTRRAAAEAVADRTRLTQSIIDAATANQLWRRRDRRPVIILE